VPTERTDLDEGDGWIHLVNVCDAHRDRAIVVNTAARNNVAVTRYGTTLDSSLEALDATLVVLWVINLSPPATEGPRITGITGAQEPTRWQRSSSSPCALAERSRERRGRLPEMAALRNGLLSGEGAFRLWAPDCGSPFRRGRSVRNARSAARR
jgi:hypothetical protein